MSDRRTSVWRTDGHVVFDQKGLEPDFINDKAIGRFEDHRDATAAVECRNFVSSCPEGVVMIPIATLNELKAKLDANENPESEEAA